MYGVVGKWGFTYGWINKFYKMDTSYIAYSSEKLLTTIVKIETFAHPQYGASEKAVTLCISAFHLNYHISSL